MGQLPNQKFHYLYRHFNKDGELLYVGITVSVVGRLVQHKAGSFWFDEIATITIEKYPTHAEVAKAEEDAIKKESPIYNRLFTPTPKLPPFGSAEYLRRQQRIKEAREIVNKYFPHQPENKKARED